MTQTLVRRSNISFGFFTAAALYKPCGGYRWRIKHCHCWNHCVCVYQLHFYVCNTSYDQPLLCCVTPHCWQRPGQARMDPLWSGFCLIRGKAHTDWTLAVHSAHAQLPCSQLQLENCLDRVKVWIFAHEAGASLRFCRETGRGGSLIFILFEVCVRRTAAKSLTKQL